MKKLNIISIVVTALIWILVISNQVYKNQPTYKLGEYIECMENGRYEEGYKLFYPNTSLKNFSKTYIVDYLENYFSGNQLVSIKKGKLLQESQDTVIYEIVYYFKNQTVQSTIGLTKQKEHWQVLFPFKASPLTIELPVGATAHVDGKALQIEGNQNQVQTILLPGKYQVVIQYPDEIKEDYIETIMMPKQNKVQSPYKTYPITIKAPKGTLVEIAGQKQRSTGEEITFENILEGDYRLTVSDEKKNLSTYCETISVSKTSQNFEVTQLSLSKEGYDALSRFINKFYKDYLHGIKRQDSEFLEDYVKAEDLPLFSKEFEEWFVDHKEIKKADIKVTVDQLRAGVGNPVEIDILEVIHLTNKEEDQDREYQIVLKWRNLVDILEPTYVIEDRKLIESLVSYRNDEGEWIQY